MLSRRHLAFGPICLLLCGQVAMAQQAPAAFSIAIVQGAGAVNYIHQKPAQVPVVKVSDASGRAVAGAKVSFEAPDSGPSATFKGARSYAAVTGHDGTVKAAGFIPNAEAGPFLVKVVAEYEGKTEEEQIQQNNVPPPAAKSGHKGLILKIAIGAAAVTGFGILLYEEFVAKNKPYGQR
jgi:hypothetical protein